MCSRNIDDYIVTDNFIGTDNFIVIDDFTVTDIFVKFIFTNYTYLQATLGICKCKVKYDVLIYIHKQTEKFLAAT